MINPQTIFKLTRAISRVTGWAVRGASRTPRNDFHHGLYIYNGSYLPWEEDSHFKRLYQEVKRRTLKDIARCYELYALTSQTFEAGVEGVAIEVGTWQGGSAAIMAGAMLKVSAKSKLYVFDTFEGIVKAGENDNKFRNRDLNNTNPTLARETIASAGLRNYEVIKGTFPEQIPEEITQHLDHIAVVHCDVDTFTSTRDIIEFVIPRLTRGAIIIFDDYGLPGCEGVTRYVNSMSTAEFVKVYNGNAHAVMIKR